jgi:2,4-dienoyl-CoA reductase-like NADH-dependent reductase (Old Yellow Enzyme family)
MPIYQDLTYGKDSPMPGENLFKSIIINGVEIRNRIVMAPMQMQDSHPPGHASEQTKAAYAARAKGGAGLLIQGGTSASRWAADIGAFSGSFRMHTDEAMLSLSELVERVHAFDAKIFVQLMQSMGRQGSSRSKGIQPVSCTAEPFVSAEEDWPEGLKFPGGISGELPRELAISEIIEMEDESANSAIRAKAL